jgi:GNAT superfamily N-acetyltransferase
MIIVKINNDNIFLLKDFLNNIENSKKNFTYYNNREITVINNHVLTVLLIDTNNDILGYGHLDYDEVLWLGICICDKHIGKGYSKIIMEYLLNYTTDKIYLTVNNTNIPAIKLYEKYGFILNSENTKFKTYSKN